MKKKMIGEELAFPHTEPKGYGINDVYHKGMTLREYYAGKALQGELACAAEGVWPIEAAHVVASRCVAFADALIKKLNEEKS